MEDWEAKILRRFAWVVKRSKEPRLPNQIGRPFRVRYGKQTRTSAVFGCSCGGHYVAETWKVKTGSIVSCGCSKSRRHHLKKHPFVSNDRERYKGDYLTQIGSAFRAYKNGHKCAVFQCCCGKKAIIRLTHVTSGASHSCGCSQGGPGIKLRSDIHFLRAIREAGVGVHVRCLDAKTLRETTDNLSGSVSGWHPWLLLGLKDPSKGWRDGNLSWISVDDHEKRQATATMSQVLSEVELLRRRPGLKATVFSSGSTANRMVAVLRACGSCPSPFHVLAKLRPECDWIPGNIVWLASPSAMKFLDLDKRRIARAQRALAKHQRVVAERKRKKKESAVAGRKAKRNEVAR